MADTKTRSYIKDAAALRYTGHRRVRMKSGTDAGTEQNACIPGFI